MSRHGGTIGKLIEGGVIDCRRRLKIQNDHRNAGSLHDRKHRVRQRIGGHIEKQNICVGTAISVTSFADALRSVNQSKLNKLYSGRVSLVATVSR